MSDELEIVTSLEEWEKLLPADVLYLQRWEWGEFRASQGDIVQRYVLRCDGGTIAAQAFQQMLGYGISHWLLSGGPVVTGDISPKEYCKFFQLLSSKAGSSVAYIRVEAPLNCPDCDSCLSRIERSFRPFRPQHTVQLKLSGRSLDDVQAGLKQKTRYNIRLSEKKGVEVKEHDLTDPELPALYHSLVLETESRDNFTAHSEQYYRDLFQQYLMYGAKSSLCCLVAWSNGQPTASIITLRDGGVVRYLYGASSSSSRSLMAPYALQWRAISDAHHSGALWYDFYGTSSLDIRSESQKYSVADEHDSWAGITRFKLGFVPRSSQGRYVVYPDSFDVVLRPMAYRLLLLRRAILY